MAIKPICDRCGEELQANGALMFGPPDNRNHTSKWHICADCWPKVLAFVNEKWSRMTVSPEASRLCDRGE